MPPGALKVDRTTRWGNPFTTLACGSAAAAVELHRRWLQGEIGAPDGSAAPSADIIRAALAGHDLACWCRPGTPCHGDLLVAIANGSDRDRDNDNDNDSG